MKVLKNEEERLIDIFNSFELYLCSEDVFCFRFCWFDKFLMLI